MSNSDGDATKVEIHREVTPTEHSEVRIRVKPKSARVRVRKVMELLRGFGGEMVDHGFVRGYGRVIGLAVSTLSGSLAIQFRHEGDSYKLAYNLHITHDCDHMKAFESFFRLAACKKQAPNFSAHETPEILDELDCTFGTLDLVGVRRL